MKLMRMDLAAEDDGLCLIHCPFGVGRTGILLAMHKIAEEIDHGAREIDVVREAI